MWVRKSQIVVDSLVRSEELVPARSPDERVHGRERVVDWGDDLWWVFGGTKTVRNVCRLLRSSWPLLHFAPGKTPLGWAAAAAAAAAAALPFGVEEGRSGLRLTKLYRTQMAPVAVRAGGGGSGGKEQCEI